MDKSFDFSGWATRANLQCADGRVILKDAFKHNDGQTVPLVWNHQHNNPEEVLGHALLENRDEGVYAYCTFNDTESGKTARLLVRHGDVDKLSIYANKLKHQGRNVIHGAIREVSLVLAGANPGAYIDTIMMHGEDSYEEGYIQTGYPLENVESLFHTDTKNDEKGEEKVAEETKKQETENKEETVMDVFNTLNEKQKKAVYVLIDQAMKDAAKEKTVKHSEEDTDDHSDDKQEVNEEEIKHAEESEDSEETVEDVLNTLTEKQKNVVYAVIGTALKEHDDEEENDDDEEVEGGNDNMKHNVFDQTEKANDVLEHSEMMAIFEEAKKGGRLSDAVLAHGIEDIEYLFPDAVNVDKTPGFIKREDSWVSDVMNSIHHTPFSRIKSVFADLTEDEARAKGYVKGKKKVDEVFTLLKRITTPTTIYKKQKIDRDDMIDITDFDVVAWLKGEMRMMLDEEIARAILVGDGRQPSNNDKINEQNVRPIWTDDDVYTVKAEIATTKDTTEDDKAKAFIKACIKSRKEYKGSGNPVMYMSEDMLTACLLLEDKNGRMIYETVEKLATTLRVKKIVTVPVMENLTRVKTTNTHTLAGIYVNLIDYNVGADKGGAVNMFDDFDIDYNQQKYLIETRCSGALIKPYSAVAIEFVQPTAEG